MRYTKLGYTSFRILVLLKNAQEGGIQSSPIDYADKTLDFSGRFT